MTDEQLAEELRAIIESIRNDPRWRTWPGIPILRLAADRLDAKRLAAKEPTP